MRAEGHQTECSSEREPTVTAEKEYEQYEGGGKDRISRISRTELTEGGLVLKGGMSWTARNASLIK